SPVFKEQGKYPVIFISFKDIKANTLKSCINSIIILMGELYKKYSFLLNTLNELDKPTYIKYATQNINFEELQRGLITLCNLLYIHYNEEVILLIDEYDTPIISAYEHGYYDEIKTFFTVLYGSALKGNLYLKKAVLTGTIEVDLYKNI
ncbi:AAA family ATPase, partial [Cetobacterium sp.]